VREKEREKSHFPPIHPSVVPLPHDLLTAIFLFYLFLYLSKDLFLLAHLQVEASLAFPWVRRYLSTNLRLQPTGIVYSSIPPSKKQLIIVHSTPFLSSKSLDSTRTITNLLVRRCVVINILTNVQVGSQFLNA